MKQICVFCGSSPGLKPEYIEMAKALGRLLAERSIRLIYGGASIGVMGALADSALKNGGEVTGVMPKFLYEKEVAHTGLTELKIVENMHERKMLMHGLAEGFIVLPGGFGTFDELFETLTWLQLGLHQKPCAILNVSSYFDELLKFMNHTVREGFVRLEHKNMLVITTEIDELLHKLQSYQAPQSGKWI